MIRHVLLFMVLVLAAGCTAGPAPVRTGGPPPLEEETVVVLDAEEEEEILLRIRDRLRVYDVEEVARAVDGALAGKEPTEEALVLAIEGYLAERKQRLIREMTDAQPGAFTEEELSEHIGGALEERLFPVILAMEKKRLGL